MIETKRVYAQIANNETKMVNYAIGEDEEFYKSIGMELMEIDIIDNGIGYVKGYVPTDVLKEIKRKERNQILEETDIYASIVDYPISEEERQNYFDYRKYLRDFPSNEKFWELPIKSFEEWKGDRQ